MNLRLAVLLAPLLAGANPEWVAAPAAATAAVPADSNTTTYSVGGVRIIHRRNNLNTVVANVYLLGGVRNAPAASSGIENLLLQVSERGTTKYTRDVLRKAMARTGSEIVIEARDDWALIGARTTPTELDSTWSILTDRIMRPRIDSSDVEFIRGQLLAALRQRDDSPDATLEYLADSTAFAGSPYALTPSGTEESIARITRGDLQRFHREQLVTSRMLLVIVGAVDRPTVERLVKSSLATLPAGSYKWTIPDTLAAPVADVVIARRGLPTNYIQGVFRGPPANSPDAAALRVASAVLSGRMFGEIRSRRNLTYAVSANYRDRALTSIGLYVTTTLPDSVISLMASEVRSLQLFEIQTEMLRPVVQQFITEYFLDNETSTAQADFLARALLYRGDVTAGERFVGDLRAVTGADVRRVAVRYFRNARWAYVGDPARLSREKLLKF
jgi:zinc protease